MQKTFRLFVSSTFGDFTEERKLLQTVVFPEIKKYCSSKKLSFQPIDLRWGVTEEASNDQKTLELCIEEVQNCKLQPYPNFLIMLGDRCGTIILPYTIEKEEFETISNNVENNEDKTLLNTWYKLDENQIPASYIIEQRKNADESFDGVDYTIRKNWKPINTKLIEIFQNVVSKIDLQESKKNKYFKSATEVEVIEGIFKYLDKTPFQNKLLNKDSSFEHKDYEHIYSYIRNIKTLDNENLKDKFKDTNPDDVNRFKETLKSSIKKENILEVNVNLTNVKQDEKNNSLNYQYDEIKDIEDSMFVNRIITYLKKSIDEYSNIIKDLTPKELELEEQKRFKNDKLKDFLEDSRKEALEKIDTYINSENENNQVLVVYGKSGLGKSSLMAKAIENNEIKFENTDTKVIYKFVGSTANLTNTPEILISILNELGINEEIRKITNPQTMQEESEKLEEFYERICEHFLKIKDNVIIFLDAIDQLSNEDVFLWLLNELPKNLKIIISALDDENYPDDSKYLQDLKTKTINLYSLEEFDTNLAEQLILNILKRYDRTITQTQMNYLLNIYKDVKTPLYLSVAAQELRHWKSSDNNQTLAISQSEIIKEFIENLTKLFHHDKEFVKRVFSYLYLSDGLSESELLEILSIDKKFIEYIAPDTYHKKESNELPIVIWARLHSQIKEFLKLEQKDNQETMKFFHREFKYAISKQGYIKNVHEELILLLQDLIKKYQDESFESNRWGSLYIEVISTYHEKYEMVMYPNSLDVYTSIKQYSEFLTTINNKKYLEYLCLYCHKRGTYLKKSMHVPPHYLINYFVTKLIYEYYGYNENKYIESLETISNSFFEQMIGIDLARKALSMRESIYKKDKNTIFEYANSLVNYASITFHPKDSIQTLEKVTKLTETLYYDSCINQKPSNFDKIVIIYIDCSLFLVYESLKFFDNPVSLYSGGFSEEYLDNFIERILEKLKAIFPIIKYNISLNQNFYLTRYYNALSKAYKRNEDIDNALDSSEKALESVNQLYINNQNEYENLYALTLNDLGILYKLKENYIHAIKCQEKNVEVRKKQYSKYPIYWAKFYLNSLGNLISVSLKYGNVENVIKLAKSAQKISEKHQMEEFTDYQYCKRILTKYKYLENINLSNNLEDILEEVTSFGITKYPEFKSLISLSFGNYNNKKAFDNYIESKFKKVVFTFKSGDFNQSKVTAKKFLKLFYPKLLENEIYKKYYDYAKELIEHNEKVQNYIIHRQMLQQILNNNDELEVQKMLKPNIYVFTLIYESYKKNSDLWWSTYIAYCIDLSFYFNRLSFKESYIFAQEVLSEINDVLKTKINTTKDQNMISQFLMYSDHLNKIIEISSSHKNSILDLEIVKKDKFLYSFLEKKYDLYAKSKSKDEIKHKIIGINCRSEEFDLTSLLKETINVFNNKFSNIELTNYDKVEALIQNNEFKNSLINWLISCVNLAQIFYEERNFGAAHEFSEIFIDCCGNVLDDNIKSSEGIMINIYNNVKSIPKTKHIKILGYEGQYLETRKLFVNAIEKNDIFTISVLIGDLDLNYIIDEEIEPEEWETPLRKAVKSGNLEIAELLIKNGANIETIDINPNGTVLFDTVINKDIEMIKLLLNYDADINQEAAWGGSPYDYVKDNNLYEIIKIFEEHELSNSKLQEYKKSLNILKEAYYKDSDRWIEDYISNLDNLASSYVRDKKFKESSKLFEEYFKIVDFNNIDHIRNFIYPFIKWYQCEKHLKNYLKLEELKDLALNFTNIYKEKLDSKFEEEINEIFEVYKDLLDNSDDALNKEKFEIFQLIFFR